MQDQDLVGDGATPPRVRWPNDARVAISLVVNGEEGFENLREDGIGRRSRPARHVVVTQETDDCPIR